MGKEFIDTRQSLRTRRCRRRRRRCSRTSPAMSRAGEQYSQRPFRRSQPGSCLRRDGRTDGDWVINHTSSRRRLSSDRTDRGMLTDRGRGEQDLGHAEPLVAQVEELFLLLRRRRCGWWLRSSRHHRRGRGGGHVVTLILRRRRWRRRQTGADIAEFVGRGRDKVGQDVGSNDRVVRVVTVRKASRTIRLALPRAGKKKRESEREKNKLTLRVPNRVPTGSRRNTPFPWHVP